MANTITLKTSSYDGRYLQVVCTQTPDEATNTSTISWTLSSVGGTANYYSTGYTELKINGKQVYYKERVNWDSYKFPAGKGSVSGTLVVEHDTTGAASVPVSLSTAIYNSTRRNASDTWELDSIPRGAYITSASNFTSDTNPTIKYYNPFGANVTSLEACISFTGGNDDVPYRAISPTGTSYTFVLTDEEKATLQAGVTSGLTVPVRFYVRTRANGETYWDFQTRIFSLSGDVNPEGTVIFYETNSAVSAATGGNENIFIPYHSALAYEITVEPQQGATITSYSVKYGSYYSSTSRTGVISGIFYPKSGTSVDVVVTDNRGNKYTDSMVLTVVERLDPWCEVDLTTLETSSGGINFKIWGGNYYDGYLDGTSNGSLGGVKNELYIQYRYKLQDGGTYTDWLNVESSTVSIQSDGMFEGEVVITGLDYMQPYVIQVRAADKIASGEATQEYVMKMEPVFDWSKKDFAVNVPLYVRDGIIMSDNEEGFAEVMRYGWDDDNPQGLEIGLDNYNRAWESEPDDARYNTSIYGNSVNLMAVKTLSVGADRVDLWSDVYIIGNKLDDFVVQQGTSGMWNYRLWKSGKAECWGTKNMGNMSVSEPFDGIYTSGKFTLDFPTGLFVVAPDLLQINISRTSGAAQVIQGYGTDISATSTGQFMIYTFAPIILQQVYVNVEARGRWK